MREDTKKRLERAIWLQRGKWIALGLAGIAVMAGVLMFISRNAAQVQVRLPATVVTVSTASSNTKPPGTVVVVKLADGKSVQVLANVTDNPKVGAQVEITEHQFANGNRTYTWN